MISGQTKCNENRFKSSLIFERVGKIQLNFNEVRGVQFVAKLENH